MLRDNVKRRPKTQKAPFVGKKKRGSMTCENGSEDESGESLIAWKSEVQLGTRQDGGPRLEEL